MRKCLEKEFPTESLGIGGVFCAKKGQLKIHVMPEFSTKPLELDSDVENWLNFYTMDSNFTCFSVFVSRDPVRPKPRVSVQGVKSLGGHFEFYEVKKFFVIIFQKENGNAFTLFYSEKSSKRAK